MSELTDLVLLEEEATPNKVTFSKESLKDQIDTIIHQVEEGEKYALEVLTAFRYVEKIIKDERLSKKLLEIAKTEFAQRKEGKEAVFNNFRIEEATVGVSYDYSADPIWQRLKQDVVEATAKLKEREGILKATKIENEIQEIDPETGELFIRIPPIKKSSSTLKFTLI